MHLATLVGWLKSPGNQPSPVPGRRGRERNMGIPGADLVGPGPGKGDIMITSLNSALGAWQARGSCYRSSWKLWAMFEPKSHRAKVSVSCAWLVLTGKPPKMSKRTDRHQRGQTSKVGSVHCVQATGHLTSSQLFCSMWECTGNAGGPRVGCLQTRLGQSQLDILIPTLLQPQAPLSPEPA